MNAVLQHVAPRMGLASSGVLFELNISVWSGRKLDKEVSMEVDADKRTRVRAGNYNKNLFAGCTELEDLTKFVSRVRQRSIQRTLPWSFSGPTYLAGEMIPEFDAEMKANQVTFYDGVEDFLRVYPSVVQGASLNLGNLFNPEDYPSVDVVRDKFSFRFAYLPVPENDFRVRVGDEEVNFLHEQYAKLIEEREKEMARTNWERLHAEAKRLASQLKDKGRIYDSTFDGLYALCQSMDAMNVTGDVELDRCRKELMAVLRTTDTAELRANETIKKGVRQDLNDILDKFSF